MEVNHRHAGTSVGRDLALVATATIAVAVFSVHFEIGEAMQAWTRSWERYQLDEFPGIALFAAVALLFALAAQAEKERQRAAAQQAKEKAVASKRAAEELINFLQYDLSERLGSLGRLDMMNTLNARIMKYHEAHPPEIGDLDAMRERSVALDQQGDLQGAQGDLAGAFKSYRDSLEIREKLAGQDPNNTGWQRDLAIVYERVGDAQFAQAIWLERSKVTGPKLLYKNRW